MNLKEREGRGRQDLIFQHRNIVCWPGEGKRTNLAIYHLILNARLSEDC